MIILNQYVVLLFEFLVQQFDCMWWEMQGKLWCCVCLLCKGDIYCVDELFFDIVFKVYIYLQCLFECVWNLMGFFFLVLNYVFFDGVCCCLCESGMFEFDLGWDDDYVVELVGYVLLVEQ